MKKLILVGALFFQLNICMDSSMTWKDHTDFDFAWCNDDSETLQTKFKRVITLINLEDEQRRLFDVDTHAANEMFDTIKKLRFSYGESGLVTMRQVFNYGVTEKKITAYLSVTNSTPNTPLTWRDGKSLLQALTEDGIMQHCAYVNIPYPINTLKILLEKGGLPQIPIGKYPSPLEIVKTIKAEEEKILFSKPSKNYLEEQNRKIDIENSTRVYHCALGIEELFKNHLEMINSSNQNQ